MQGNSSVSAKTLAPVYWGVAPYPTYFFALMQKSKQKKSRLRLPRTKNYACRRKKSELAPPTSVLKQQIFFTARCTCFSAHQPMPEENE
jgi:hypothetical protein